MDPDRSTAAHPARVRGRVRAGPDLVLEGAHPHPATPANEAELVPIAERTPASDLGRELARWLHGTQGPSEIAEHQHRRRGVRWRCEPDGMIHFGVRLEPLVAGRLIAALTTRVMRTRKGPYADGWPSVAQQYADAFDDLVSNGSGRLITELVLHVRGDGTTLDDGTPIPTSVVERIAPQAFLRALIHDAEGRPINASGRQRHPDRPAEAGGEGTRSELRRLRPRRAPQLRPRP